MSLDPVVTNPDHYKVIFENDRIRALEYTDVPGDKTTSHEHPDSFMFTLSTFQRRLHAGDRQLDVAIEAGTASWLPAQEHWGENVGETPTHVIFVELKDGSAEPNAPTLGPT